MRLPSHLTAREFAPHEAAARVSGFTLIELMVAVAVVAILAAIAIPAYSAYIVRGHIPNATNGLSAAAAQMEQFFQDYRSYQQVGNSPNPPCLTPVVSGDFTISCVAIANPPAGMTAAGIAPGVTQASFVLYASGSGATAGFSYTLDNNGRQWSQAGAAWSSLVCPNTWIMKSGIC